MARPLRIQYPGAFYHVMNRGVNHSPIFYDKVTDRALFKQTLEDAVRLWKIRLHAYSLMDNHYHLLIETPLPNLSRAMQHIDGIYTQRFNRKHRRDGPLIRGRFKSILVEQEKYFLELIRYIHLNGCRALRYPSARVDPNGSHKDYLDLERSLPWLEKRLALSYFANNLDAFDQFVHAGVSEELDKKLKSRRWPAILGTKEFIASMRVKILPSEAAPKDIPDMLAIQRATTIEPNALIEMVLEFSERQLSLNRKCGELNKEGRWSLLVALRRYSHLSYHEIAMLVGGNSYDAIDKFIRRNDFSASIFFKEIESWCETQMSNVEI